MSDWDASEMIRRLRSVPGLVRAAAADGLRAGGEVVLQESDERVPLETGALRSSGKVSVDRAGLKAAISYDTPYAVLVHEVMDNAHDAGRSAKFLETALMSRRDDAAEAVAESIREALR